LVGCGPAGFGAGFGAGAGSGAATTGSAGFVDSTIGAGGSLRCGIAQAATINETATIESVLYIDQFP
jgi:hypothetical protein